MADKAWSPRVDDELGNYDYLLGADVGLPPPRFSRMYTDRLKIDHNHPDVAKDLLAWGSWVLQVRLAYDNLEPKSQPRNEHPDDGGEWIQTRCDKTHRPSVPSTICTSPGHCAELRRRLGLPHTR